MQRTAHGVAGGLLSCMLSAGLASAQSLQRTPNLTGGWVGTPYALQFNTEVRYRSLGHAEFASLPTLMLAYGLRENVLLGASFAVQSPVVLDQTSELEPFVRWAPVIERVRQPWQVSAELAFNTAAVSVDGELEAAYRFGPARLLGAARFFSNGYGEDPRGALAAGLVVHPAPGRVPVALAGDIAGLLGSGRGNDVVWSAGLQAGLPITPSTLSLQVTNATSATLEGRSLGTGRVRFGFELTLASPIGELLGLFVPREVAMQAVRSVQQPAGRAVQVAIREFAFVGERIVIPAGTTVQWTNYDDVVHTATSDDAAWNSGAIPPGRSWSATFEQPGTYSYHCGPHPYMRGSIVVQ